MTRKDKKDMIQIKEVMKMANKNTNENDKFAQLTWNPTNQKFYLLTEQQLNLILLKK